MAKSAQQRYGLEPAGTTRKPKARPVVVGKRFADGGFVASAKKALGMGPKKSMLDEELEKIAKRDAAAAAKAAEPAKPAEAPKQDNTKRRQQIDDAERRAVGG